MKLWLDAGNTRLMWQLYQGKKLIAQGNLIHAGDFKSAVFILADKLQTFANLNEIAFIGLASVLNPATLSELELACKESLGLEPSNALVTRELKGVVCAYKDLSKLGVDRWLALVAAFNQRKAAVCVVDCGSAITIDMVNNAGEHIGGFILPGLNMSIRALLGQTQSVRFDGESKSNVLSLGRDTASAVLNGVLLQAQSSVKEACRIFEKECLNGVASDSSCLFITGGDADKVLEGLSYDFVKQDDLVIRGLRLTLE